MATKWDNVEVETEKVIDTNPEVWINAAQEELSNKNYDTALEKIQQAKIFADEHEREEDKIAREMLYRGPRYGGARYFNKVRYFNKDLEQHCLQKDGYYALGVICDVIEAYIYAKTGDYGKYLNKILSSKDGLLNLYAVDYSNVCNKLYDKLSLKLKWETYLNAEEYLKYEQMFQRYYDKLQDYYGKLQGLQYNDNFKKCLEHFYINYEMNWIARKTYLFYVNGHSNYGDKAVEAFNQEFVGKPLKILNLSVQKVSSDEFNFIKNFLKEASENKEIAYTVAFVEAIP